MKSSKINNENYLCLYGITDRRWSKTREGFFKKIEESLKGGVTIVQMREKNMDYDDMVSYGKELKTLCDKYGALLVINDFVQVAKAVGAHGVHLGQEDENLAYARKTLGDDAIIGISASTLGEALVAQASGADYIGVGAVFATDTKDNAETISKEDYIEISQKCKLPNVAIGGISLENIDELSHYGIKGAAIISDIYSKDVSQIKEHCLKLKAKLEDIVGCR